MSTSKNRKPKHTRSIIRTDPRASTTSMVAPSKALYLPLPYPVWQISEVTATIQQVAPSLSTEVLLEMLLSHPLQIRDADEQVTTITPLQLVGHENASASDVLSSLEALHELGALAWDATTRTHLLIDPAST